MTQSKRRVLKIRCHGHSEFVRLTRNGRSEGRPRAKISIGWCTLVMKQPSPGEKLLAALELQELGLQVKKTQIKRNNPDATPEQIHQLFLNWLLTRNPLPDGFRVVSWPRK